jgi:type I site-specific restriction endonuclease
VNIIKRRKKNDTVVPDANVTPSSKRKNAMTPDATIETRKSPRLGKENTVSQDSVDNTKTMELNPGVASSRQKESVEEQKIKKMEKQIREMAKHQASLIKVIEEGKQQRLRDYSNENQEMISDLQKKGS